MNVLLKLWSKYKLKDFFILDCILCHWWLLFEVFHSSKNSINFTEFHFERSEWTVLMFVAKWTHTHTLSSRHSNALQIKIFMNTQEIIRSWNDTFLGLRSERVTSCKLSFVEKSLLFRQYLLYLNVSLKKTPIRVSNKMIQVSDSESVRVCVWNKPISEVGESMTSNNPLDV
jgi:hypothetical protein